MAKKSHLGGLAKQVIESHLDRFVIFTGNEHYLTTILPSLDRFDGDELRPQLQQVLGVAKAFGSTAVKALSQQILNGVNQLLRGECETLDLDLAPLLNLGAVPIAKDSTEEKEVRKLEVTEKSTSPVPSISPIPKADEIPRLMEEQMKKEKEPSEENSSQIEKTEEKQQDEKADKYSNDEKKRK